MRLTEQRYLIAIRANNAQPMTVIRSGLPWQYRMDWMGLFPTLTPCAPHRVFFMIPKQASDVNCLE